MPLSHFKSLFRPSPGRSATRALLEVLIAAARLPEFYLKAEVPDTLDGRFDMVALHLYVLLRRLKSEGEEGREAAQRLFDAAFANFDESLREIGIGDLSVGKKIRKMAEAFYGRVSVYEAAQNTSEADFADAVVRNVYRGVSVSPAAQDSLSKLTRQFRDSVESAGRDELLAGSWSYGGVVRA